MENRNNTLIIILLAIVILLSWGLTKDFNERQMTIAPLPDHICKEDSLRESLNQLQMVINSEEDGWDKKEQRYEDILFEYEYGLNRLKETHPEAYKEFHRIISYRERYSKGEERENKKRLTNNF